MSVETYVVVASALNVRDKPSVSGQVLDSLANGSKVYLDSISGDGYWARVKKTKTGKTIGWVSLKYLKSAGFEPAASSKTPWFDIAAGELGVKEFTGAADNPRIVQYLCSTTLPAPARNNDETFWCSAFVNWCVEKAGYAGTDSAWAKSWLNWGKAINQPVPGCVTVFKRGDGGHVAFFVRREGSKIIVRGGNQSDSVCEAAYKSVDLLGYRMP